MRPPIVGSELRDLGGEALRIERKRQSDEGSGELHRFQDNDITRRQISAIAGSGLHILIGKRRERIAEMQHAPRRLGHSGSGTLAAARGTKYLCPSAAQLGIGDVAVVRRKAAGSQVARGACMVQIAQYPRSRGRPFSGEIKPVALAIGLAFGLSVGAIPVASAGTITVNNLAGGSVGGQCTLRDAIAAANTDAVVNGCAAGSGADTINFSVTGPISLASEILITSNVTINGPGAGAMTITPTARALTINNAGTPPTVTISGLAFQGANAAGAGGAIAKLNGTLTIQSSTFTSNQTSGTFAGGGALYNALGNLTIQDSTFSGNTGAGGGALYQSQYAGTLTIQNSTFANNTARRAGGALYATSGNITIQNSTFSGNHTLNGFSGGALYAGGGTVTVLNSTFSGNSAAGSGGAIYLNYASVLNLTSTIAAGSTDSAGTRDIVGSSGSIVNASNDLIQNPSGFTFGTNTANITGQNPLLGPLANNGGPTQTMGLLLGSPAIDKGANPGALPFDQRGSGFARTVGAQTDIGAFEVQGAPPPPPPVASVPVPTLSQWGTVLLGILMAGWGMLTGFGRRRRR
jgi:predicted outer membrane repeat protein